MTMKALVVSASEPPHARGGQHGTQLRTRLYLRALQNLDARIDIAYFVTDPDALDSSVSESVRSGFDAAYWGVEIATRHFIRIDRRSKSFANEYLAGAVVASAQPEYFARASKNVTDRLSEIIRAGEYDVILVRSLAPMLALSKVGIARTRTRIVFDLDDIQHRVKWRENTVAPWYPGKGLKLMQIPALFMAERRCAAVADATVICSPDDQRWLERKGFSRVYAIPNAVRLPAYIEHPAKEPNCLFLGLAHYEPNARAIERLVTRIFPMIKAAIPEARLLVAGESSDLLKGKWTQSTDVEFMGFVPDLDALYAQARLFVCPLSNGGGTRLKIIEAAGYGVPVVTTRIGAEGLDFKEGEAIVIRDEDESLAAACIELLRDASRHERMRIAARRVTEQLYDEAKIIGRMQTLLAPERSTEIR
ncbi:glycosyltransferase family 4 protein [Acidihalobacter ferrooxydans]|uniref:Glycosyltransferase subfamily 4-like N-terminal domain-containing protein n=1 Tax=Acidihalobacter ferrooxydans TaxID=1765967 RepID=A0A1P8UI05_9GAMM|nr:glycosyltransferase family 4 protein [Acidihalobacter ferrooxydans]APZ43473.1 hypothetical protein BW247_10550 [Acidihalobacter ferrooxydans]